MLYTIGVLGERKPGLARLSHLSHSDTKIAAWHGGIVLVLGVTTEPKHASAISR